MEASLGGTDHGNINRRFAAVDAQIKSCNKLIHKDTIAGLTKYKTVVIPAEKTALDKTFNGFKAA